MPGDNLIAAEVHQGNATSSDLSFDLELSGTLRAETSVTIVVEEGSPSTDTDADGLPDSWEQEHFGVNGTAPTADPDADGIVNLIEYALATDPNLPSQQGLAPSLATEVNQKYFEITYTRRKGTSLTFTLQTSADLASWQNAETFLETAVNDNQNGTETIKYRLDQAVDNESGSFIRLQIRY